MKRILILGGGAAGMVSAIAAKEASPETDVVLVEGNPRIGKKLLATGNGRCNLGNVHIGPECYFTNNPGQLTRMLENMENPVQWFQAHGLLTRSDEAGRIYPCSGQAADVLNLLLFHLERLGVKMKTDSPVKAVIKKGTSFTVTLESGTKLFGNALILALGGSAGPQFGTSGFGLELAEALGLQTEESYPCLVPLKCKKHQISGLGGIRVRAQATLWDGDKMIAAENGEIQFTNYGLSGIAIMQLSGHLPRLYRPEIRLNLFPDYTPEELHALLEGHLAVLDGAAPEVYMTGLMHRRVGMAVWASAGLPESGPVSSNHLSAFAQALQSWRFSGLSPTDYQSAQTAGGGLGLSQLSPETFEVRRIPGLFIVGETLDAAGLCGGYNLHWAFGSGITAGRAAATIQF